MARNDALCTARAVLPACPYSIRPKQSERSAQPCPLARGPLNPTIVSQQRSQPFGADATMIGERESGSPLARALWVEPRRADRRRSKNKLDDLLTATWASVHSSRSISSATPPSCQHRTAA